MKPEKKVKNLTRKKNKITKKKGSNKLLGAGLLVLIFLAVIGYAFMGSDDPEDKSSKEKEIQLPSYAYTNPLTLKAYRYATEHPENLEQIPCYCGCGNMAHRFLRDCFIKDDGTYEEHASFCDICVGETLKVQEYLEKGMTLKEVRAKIDSEYSKYIDGKTSTPPVSDFYKPILTGQALGLVNQYSTPVTREKVDLSQYSLSEEFNSLEDGLKLTPGDVNRAYFINNKLLSGTVLEDRYTVSMSRDDTFYGKKVIGMYSADYSPSSWIEMHDLGYDNKNDGSLTGVIEQGMKNIVYTRPLIYGHAQNVDNVLELLMDSDSMVNSFGTYSPLLNKVDYQSAGVAMVVKEQTGFSDMNYWSLTPANGLVGLVKAYNVTDKDSIPATFDRYDYQVIDNILVIEITGDMLTVQTEKDNIDAVAREP